MSGWIGVDFDGTLAEYHGWEGELNFGAPIPVMVGRVKRWLAAGHEVRIVTARADDAFNANTRAYIMVMQALEDWSATHIGQVLPITSRKDLHMIVLYDDRCVQVEPNTGRISVDDGSEITDPRVPFRPLS